MPRVTFCLSPCGCASPCAETCPQGAHSEPAPRGVPAQTPRAARCPGRRCPRPHSESLPGLFALHSCPMDAFCPDSSYLSLACRALLLCKRRKQQYFNFVFFLSPLMLNIFYGIFNTRYKHGRVRSTENGRGRAVHHSNSVGAVSTAPSVERQTRHKSLTQLKH